MIWRSAEFALKHLCRIIAVVIPNLSKFRIQQPELLLGFWRIQNLHFLYPNPRKDDLKNP